MAGQASIDKVAGPVGEALIMTAIGLGGRCAGRAGLQLAGATATRSVMDVKCVPSPADLHGVLMGNQVKSPSC